MIESRRLAKSLAILLLAIGAVLWMWAAHGNIGPPDQWIVLPIMVTAALLCVRWNNQLWVNRLRGALHRHQKITAMLVAVIAATYFLVTAQSRDLKPKYHDEFIYLMQAHMLARGHLWMPAHQLGDFFDSEYVLDHPVYTVQTWPGYSMILAAGIWLHIMPWMVSVLISSAVVGLLFWIVAEWLSVEWGLLGALLLVAVGPFRHQSVSINAFGASLLFGMVMIVAWINWMRSHAIRWASLFGLMAGWAAITRPIDAVCFAAPLCAAALIEALRSKVSARRFLATVGAAAVVGAPFIAVQLILNERVTGHWYQTQFLYYNKRDAPQETFGFPKYDPSLKPLSRLPQKQIIYQDWVVPFVIAHQPGNAIKDWLTHRIPMTLAQTAPHPLLILLLPIGLFLAVWPRWWVMLLQIPLFSVLYGCYTVFLPHYSMIIAPAMIVVMLLGAKQLCRAWPVRMTKVLVPAAMVGLALSMLPQVTGIPEDPNPSPSVMAARQLPHFIHQPAVVLFRYRPWNNVHDEPVYNTGVAWPDDARIIRAHDLGLLRNQEIFHYYAMHQPWRVFYLLDQGDESLHYLGTAPELAARFSTPKAPPIATTFP